MQQNWIGKMFGHLKDGIILVDRKRNIVAMNPAMEKMMGLKAAAIVNKKRCHDVLGCKGCPFGSSFQDSLHFIFHAFVPLTKSGVRRNIWSNCLPLKGSLENAPANLIIVSDKSRKKREDIVPETSLYP